MFAENERISLRQFKRLLTLELFGVTTALLPGILCERVRQDGILSLAVGIGFVCIFGLLLHAVGRKSGRSLQQTLKERSTVWYDIFLFIMIVQMILMGIWVLSLVSELCRDILLKESEYGFVVITFSVVCLIGAWKGMECRGRMAEVLYLFLLVPFVVLLILAAGKMDADSIEPVFVQPFGTIASGSYEVFIVFQGVTLGFFALPYLKKQTYFWKGVRRSVLLNGFFCLLLLVVAIGIFGLNGAANQKWLAVNLMTTPDFPGGFVERLDVLMVTIWIVALFFFVSGVYFYSGKMAGRLLRMKCEKCGLAAVAILITVGSILCGGQIFSYYIYMNYMKYIGVPLQILLLLMIGLRVRTRKAAAVMMALVLISPCLSGCARGVELEDREFVLALGVDYDGEKITFVYDTSRMESEDEAQGEQTMVSLETEHFSELLSAYGQQSDRYLDCNHLKALIIGRGLASDQEKLIQFLEYIQKQEMFASNVKLFFAEEDLDSVFAAGEKLDGVLGEYLENLYIDSNYYVEGQSASVGGLIKHWRDYDETLLVPVLSAGEDGLSIGSYAVVRQVQWIDLMDSKAAELVFMGNGVPIRLLEQGSRRDEVLFEHVSKTVSYTDGVTPQAVLTLELRGQVVNREIKSEKEKRQLEKELNARLEQRYKEELTDWNGLDVFHLFRAMGRYNRQMWLKYHSQRETFDELLQVQVKVRAQIM